MGDAGFDPAGFAKNKRLLPWYREASVDFSLGRNDQGKGVEPVGAGFSRPKGTATRDFESLKVGLKRLVDSLGMLRHRMVSRGVV